MRKIIYLFFAGSFLAACGSSESKQSTTPGTDATSNPDYQKGLALVSKSDCFSCHKINDPLTGPTYVDVAKKYANYPDTIVEHLANKIIHGGNGVWGEPSMTPHAGISQEDAQAMVKYILSLKQ